MKPAQLIASIGTDDLARCERLLDAFLRERRARGTGGFDTLKAVSKLALESLS